MEPEEPSHGTWPPGKRRTLRWLVLGILATPALLFGASLLGWSPWSTINSTHQDVDIRGGRIRHTRYLFGLRVRESVEDSALTRALQLEEFTSPAPEWHPAVTLSPGLRHSPHFVFHSAIAQIRHLELVWELAEFTPAARRTSARRILELWQQAGRDDGAKPYLKALDRLAVATRDEGKAIDAGDLPNE